VSGEALQRQVNLFDLEREALARLPVPARDYYCGGATDEITLRDNRAAYDRIALHYRVLRDVSRRDASTTVLGADVSLPVLIAPTAFHQMAHADGELATARAAHAARTLMILSTLSTCEMEDVAAAAQGAWWFQLYVYRDRGVTRELMQRAVSAGCKAIVLTVDAPVGGLRERDVHNRFALPPGLKMCNLRGAGREHTGLEEDMGGVSGYFTRLLDPTLSWRDLAALAAESPVPVIVKGIVRADDAVRARDNGAAGIVVSNHGGRQLDTAPAPIEVLERIATAVDHRLEVYVDGGVRRGTDVLKALALGARAVLIGRPVLWGLACAGEAGVTHALEILRRELDVAMALTGCRTLAEIDVDLIRPPMPLHPRPDPWRPA
jgi:4-hydroxymandelate oxidase